MKNSIKTLYVTRLKGSSFFYLTPELQEAGSGTTLKGCGPPDARFNYAFKNRLRQMSNMRQEFAYAALVPPTQFITEKLSVIIRLPFVSATTQTLRQKDLSLLPGSLLLFMELKKLENVRRDPVATFLTHHPLPVHFS